jgi:hypothetical protein
MRIARFGRVPSAPTTINWAKRALSARLKIAPMCSAVCQTRRVEWATLPADKCVRSSSTLVTTRRRFSVPRSLVPTCIVARRTRSALACRARRHYSTTRTKQSILASRASARRSNALRQCQTVLRRSMHTVPCPSAAMGTRRAQMALALFVQRGTTT